MTIDQLQDYSNSLFLKLVPGAAKQLAIPCYDGMISVDPASGYLDEDEVTEHAKRLGCSAGDVVRLGDGAVTEYHTPETAERAIPDWVESIAETVRINEEQSELA